MLLRIFKGTGPGVIFLIIITLILIWVSGLLNQRLHPRFIYETDPMPLYALLKITIHNSHILGVIVSFLMVCVMSFILVNFNTSGFFINERTFLPAVFYILIRWSFSRSSTFKPCPSCINIPDARDNQDYGRLPHYRNSL